MILFWKILLISIMVLFFSAALVVAVKGFTDLLLMFADLRSGGEEEDEDSET